MNIRSLGAQKRALVEQLAQLQKAKGQELQQATDPIKISSLTNQINKIQTVARRVGDTLSYLA